MNSLFLDPVEKDSGETTSYSGRIDSQFGRNNSGRTGHRGKRPASSETEAKLSVILFLRRTLQGA